MQEILSSARVIVLHLWEAGIAQELDEHLTLCAQEYLGTRFVRTPVSRSKTWLRHQQCSQGPQLLSIRDGRVVGSVSIGELQLSTAMGSGVAGDGHCSDVSSDFGSDDEDATAPFIQVLLSHLQQPWL
jgi:hypothetical protein